MTKLCNFGKEIKKRLVDIDKNQELSLIHIYRRRPRLKTRAPVPERS